MSPTFRSGRVSGKLPILSRPARRVPLALGDEDVADPLALSERNLAERAERPLEEERDRLLDQQRTVGLDLDLDVCVGEDE